MHSRFELTPEQIKMANEWLNKHDKVCPFTTGELPQGAIGERITYKFTPTSLGLAASVHCGCGEEVDLTEYDKW